MVRLFLGIMISSVLYWYLRHYRRRRSDAAHHLVSRIWWSTGHQLRAMPDKTQLVPTDELAREAQWAMARSLRDDGLLEIRPLDTYSYSRYPGQRLVVLTLTERGRETFGFQGRRAS